MASELKISYNGASATLYAVIRRVADEYVYNGTSFAAYVDGSVATYDLPLSDQGGDVYSADFPSTIDAGEFLILYYEQAGGSPATTDLLLASEDRHWDGTILGEDDSDIALSAYALTTLANQKRYLQITDSGSDSLLSQLINAISAEIERVCGVQFLSRARRERYNGVGQQRLTLKQWPVTDLRRLSWGNGAAMTVTYSGSAVRAEVGVSDTSVRISTTATSGTVTTSNFTFAVYPTVTLAAAAIGAVSGWSATVNANTASADLNPLGGADAKSKTVILGYPDRGDIAYTVDYPTGLIELQQGGFGGQQRFGGATGYESRSVFPCDAHQYILCEYTAGFAAVPADVELICNRLVQDAYNDTFVARNVTMASLGPFTWKSSGAQTQTIREELAAYVDVSKCIGAA